MVLKKIVHWKL